VLELDLGLQYLHRFRNKNSYVYPYGRHIRVKKNIRYSMLLIDRLLLLEFVVLLLYKLQMLLACMLSDV